MKRTAIGFLKDTYGKNKTLFEITDSMKPHDVAKAMEDYAAEVVKNINYDTVLPAVYITLDLESSGEDII